MVTPLARRATEPIVLDCASSRDRLFWAAQLLADACATEFAGHPIVSASEAIGAEVRCFAPKGAATMKEAFDAFAAVMADCYGVPLHWADIEVATCADQPFVFKHCFLGVSDQFGDWKRHPRLIGVGTTKHDQAKVRRGR